MTNADLIAALLAVLTGGLVIVGAVQAKIAADARDQAQVARAEADVANAEAQAARDAANDARAAAVSAAERSASAAERIANAQEVANDLTLRTAARPTTAQADDVQAWTRGLKRAAVGRVLLPLRLSFVVLIRNASDDLVTDAFVLYRWDRGDGATLDEHPVGTLPPGETVKVELPVLGRMGLDGIQFTDAVGRVWIRRQRDSSLHLTFDPTRKGPGGVVTINGGTRGLPPELW